VHALTAHSSPWGSYLQMLHLDEGGAQISAVSYDAGTFGLLYPRLAVTPDGLNCVTGAAPIDG
jgi:hypothetical protein